MQNGINAFRLGGHGDMTEKNSLWQYTKSLPNVPSPLLYKDVLYMVKEGGILTALDPATGKVLKQGRLTGAPGLLLVTRCGRRQAVHHQRRGQSGGAEARRGLGNPVGQLDLEDGCNATPAIVDGTIYLRTHTALWCFGQRN